MLSDFAEVGQSELVQTASIEACSVLAVPPSASVSLHQYSALEPDVAPLAAALLRAQLDCFPLCDLPQASLPPWTPHWEQVLLLQVLVQASPLRSS